MCLNKHIVIFTELGRDFKITKSSFPLRQILGLKILYFPFTRILFRTLTFLLLAPFLCLPDNLTDLIDMQQ